jgi:YbbR domain-containing protein
MRVITRHWPLKLASLAVAVGLWLLVAVGDRIHLAVSAPVEYVGVPADVLLVPDERERVDLQLQVARFAASRVGSDSVRVRVNVASLAPGDNRVLLSAADVQVPPGVRVVRINPAALRVAVVPAAEGTLRVAPQVRGQPAEGYRVARVVAEPSRVEVKGPRSTIAVRDTVETAPVDITGSRGPITQTVGLVLPDMVYPLRGGNVQVTVDIRPESALSRSGTP